MKAPYLIECLDCPDMIHPGQEMRRRSYGWTHVDCSVIGSIKDASISLISRDGDDILIPVDPRDSLDDSRVVTIHISQVRGLIGMLQHVGGES